MQQYPPGNDDDLVLRILSVEARTLEGGGYGVYLTTTRGPLTGKLTVAEGAPGAVIFGSTGSLEEHGPGPGGGLYGEIADDLAAAGVSSLRLFFRLGHAPEPPGFDECVLDMLGAVSFLRGVGAQGIALVGTSFAGGVVIKAGSVNPHVTAVVAMASQLHGARYHADKIAPRPLLLIHGEDDNVLEIESSQIILEWAKDPKELVTFPEMGHGLGGPHRDDLKALLTERLISFVGPEALTPRE
ncbi:MAG: hypothetical protein NTZ05_16010 [Chloroflexi bacterium]|nr:hypothetical protein [Chloroflexota bacterium]